MDYGLFFKNLCLNPLVYQIWHPFACSGT